MGREKRKGERVGGRGRKGRKRGGGCVMALGGSTPLSAIKKKVETLRTDGKWDEVLATATELAMELDIDAVVQEKRKKVPRRTDDSDRNTRA